VISLDSGCSRSYVMIVCDTILFSAVNLDRVVKLLNGTSLVPIAS
jgi:hypothetical protein